MNKFLKVAPCLLVLIVPLWAQESGKDKTADTPPAEVCVTREIRAYLLNKSWETFDIAGITALLVAEGKDGQDLLIPLQGVTPKAGERDGFQSWRVPRKVKGTESYASLILVPREANRRSERDDSDRRLAMEQAQELPLQADQIGFRLEGPYFKAELTREQLGALTCHTSVRFSIKGVNHTARGFRCALSREEASPGTTCPRLLDEGILLERHLKAGELKQAGEVVDRMSVSLREPCTEAACRHVRHGCASCCEELRAAISSGDHEKALQALTALQSPWSPCAPSRNESGTDGDLK